MSSRSGSHARRQRSRDPQDDVPQLPPLSSIMSSQPQRDTNAASAPSSTRSQAHTRFWPSAASRRAERIRNLDPSHDRAYSQFTRALGHAWDSSISAATAAAAAANTTDNDFSRSFEHVNSHLRALIDITSQSPATTFAPAHNHHPYTSAGHRQQPDFGSAGSRSHKRRKIDETQQSIPRPPPLRYGRYGQVEQGKLWMDMIRCDGGMFSNESSYAATNILRDDSSVYCTKGNRCNIVLQHHGATAFTLEELVIRGPTSINYSHPVREGMVFVTMDHDEVLERTAQYQIQYAPAASLENACDDDDDDVDDDDSTRPTISIRHDNDGTSTRVRRSGLYRGEVLDEYRAAQMPPEFCLSRPNVGVSTQCDDDPILARSNHLFPEAHGSRRRAHAHRPAPNHIGPLPFESFDPDEDYEQPDYYNEMLDGIRPSLSQQQPPQTTPSFDPANPWGTDVGGSSLSLDETRRAHGNATHRAPSAAGGELLAPHARFLIEKRKSMCTIRFDPPVTGRFILLKVWNSHQDPTSNIDIQSVVVKGFSGPRFFPSVQLR